MQDVAVKQLDRNGFQGNREFLVEVLLLSLLHHTNLVNLVGYCADGDQRILVYEYMSNGSLEDHLLGMPKTTYFPILITSANLQEKLLQFHSQIQYRKLRYTETDHRKAQNTHTGLNHQYMSPHPCGCYC